MKSHGAQKIDFKLKEVDPNAGSDAKEEERLIVPPLKNETIKDEQDNSNITKVKITMHRYNPVNVTENFKPANEVKEEKAPVVASPVPAAEEPYKINITVSKDDVKEKPAEVKAPPPPQPDLPLEEPAPK